MRLAAFIGVLLLSAGAYAEGVSLDLEAQPLELALLGNVRSPATDETVFRMDTGSGVHARMHIYYAYLALDYEHYYDLALDQLHAGVGYSLPLEMGRSGTWFSDARCVLRASLGFLMMGGQASMQGKHVYRTEMGGRLGVMVSMEFGLTRFLVAGAHMGIDALYAKDLGFRVSLIGTIGLRL